MTATAVTTDVPWAPASQVAKARGLNICIFGHPGVGKTFLLGQAEDVLVFNWEGGEQTLADRDDVMMWPRPNEDGTTPEITWDGFIRTWEMLKRRPHPFKTFGFDTLSAAQRLCLDKVMRASPTPDTPSLQEYGKANELLLAFIRDACAMSKEKGWNVIFLCHAEERADENSGIIYTRMALTPGVVKGVNQTVDTIGYLAESTNQKSKATERRLLLHSTPRIIAKHRQPSSGPQLPSEISNPNLQDIINHVRGVKPYTPEGGNK